MSNKNKNIEEHHVSSAVNDHDYSAYPAAEVARLKEIWKTVNTSTTPEMLSMNTSGSKDFDRFVKNIKLVGI